jgi:hypothetical protein
MRFECICEKCKSEHYSDKYDSYYCEDRNIWLEHKCIDKKCCFCSLRPEFPDMKKEKKLQEEIKKLVKKQMKRQKQKKNE